MIICIVGPTGVGKTKLSIALAHKYNAIIVNADAMQVYKNMNIATAKIKDNQKEDIPHLLFDIVDVNTFYSVYNYQVDARKIIEEYKNRNIIFVGGTGLYIKATFFNYVFQEENTNINDYQDYTNLELYNLALEKDQNMNIHVNNRKRLIRFLNKENTKIEECYPLYDVKFIGLTTNRDILYKRINERVDEMFLEGIIDEAKNLYNYRDTKALKTAIGYKEIYNYLDGDITLDEAKELIKKKSRNYAKRQYTWFNNQLDVKWFNVNFDEFSETVKDIVNYIGGHNE